LSTHLISYFLISYILGSIPFGYIIFFLSEKKDIRKFGSGNIGATNLLRTKGKTAGILTLALDILKAVIPVVYGRIHFNEFEIIIAGLLVILGHTFPVFLKFKGGKGVASFCGFFLFYDWKLLLLFLIVFFTTLAISRFVSLGSLLGSIALFLGALVTREAEISLIVFVIVLLIIIRHNKNIMRLIKGEESRFQWKKS
jgi:glycerol-3-phosphate acyltransferase PlsY